MTQHARTHIELVSTNYSAFMGNVRRMPIAFPGGAWSYRGISGQRTAARNKM